MKLQMKIEEMRISNNLFLANNYTTQLTVNLVKEKYYEMLSILQW